MDIPHAVVEEEEEEGEEEEEALEEASEGVVVVEEEVVEVVVVAVAAAVVAKTGLAQIPSMLALMYLESSLINGFITVVETPILHSEERVTDARHHAQEGVEVVVAVAA